MPSMRLRFQTAARVELAEAYRRYEDDYPGRGIRFRNSVEALLERVIEAPLSLPRWSTRTQVRSAVVPGFPFKVIFGVEGELVVVYAVAHDKRRPGYWRNRKPIRPGS